MFFFLQKGPESATYVIKGIKQIDENHEPKVEFTSGGIGSKYLTAIVTSEYGKPIASTLEFYGEKIVN